MMRTYSIHVSLRRVLLLVASLKASSSFLIDPSLRSPLGNTNPQSSRLFSSYGQNDQVMEAIQSLVNFHEGTWKGTAKSFAVVADTAAGVVYRKTSPEYTVSVKLGMDIAKRDFSLTETFAWDDKLSSRVLSLNDCNVDVDSVDASYSLDSSLPDFPSGISGTDKLCQFVVEHCIAASEDRRMRCFVLYGVDQSLQRIVVCQEQREEKSTITTTEKQQQQPQLGDNSSSQLTSRDLLEMQSDVDRLVDKITGKYQEGEEESSSSSSDSTSEEEPSESRFDRLGESMTSSPSSSEDGGQKLSLHEMSLLEVSSGVWLGDVIIRDMPMIADSPTERGQGFGASLKQTPKKEGGAFGSWSVGVQKIAWRWMWNFGDEIRQVVDVGKGMGARVAGCMTKSLSGSVCVNESISRRMPKDQRMVYVDWSANDMVGFLVGPMSIQVPRYLSFDSTKLAKPFYTEFCLYQGTEGVGANDPEGEDNMALPKLCCSKISRVYNFEGKLKQGCTSFYTYQRFGTDETE